MRTAILIILIDTVIWAEGILSKKWGIEYDTSAPQLVWYFLVIFIVVATGQDIKELLRK